MIPFNLVVIIALVTALVSGFGSWFVTDGLADAEIAAIEKRHAEQERDDATAALTQFKEDAKVIHDAAEKAQLDLSAVNAELVKIRKGRKDAPPLPPDCVPEPVRMRSLSDSVDATNRAIAGREPRR